MATLYGSRYNEPWRGLPSELRKMICEEAVHYPEGIRGQLMKRNEFELPDSPARAGRDQYPYLLGPPLRPGVLRACKEAYCSAFPALYSNAFHLTGNSRQMLVVFQTCLPREGRLLIRQISIPEQAMTKMWNPRKYINRLVSFLLTDMLLDSVTMTSEQDGFPYYTWFLQLSSAVLHGRLAQLRITKTLQSHTKRFVDITAITALYEDTLDDHTTDDILDSLLAFELAADPTHTDETAEVVRFIIEKVVRQYQSLYPFQVFVDNSPSSSEDGGVIVVTELQSFETTEKKIRELAESVERGEAQQFGAEASDFPVAVPSLEHMISRAYRNLGRYWEAFMVPQTGFSRMDEHVSRICEE